MDRRLVVAHPIVAGLFVTNELNEGRPFVRADHPQSVEAHGRENLNFGHRAIDNPVSEISHSRLRQPLVRLLHLREDPGAILQDHHQWGIYQRRDHHRPASAHADQRRFVTPVVSMVFHAVSTLLRCLNCRLVLMGGPASKQASSVPDNGQVTTDIPDIDMSVDGPTVDEMHPRADPSEFTEFEVRLHRRPSRVIDTGRNRKDPTGAVDAHRGRTLALSKLLGSNSPIALRSILQVLFQTEVALSLKARLHVVRETEQRIPSEFDSTVERVEFVQVRNAFSFPVNTTPLEASSSSFETSSSKSFGYSVRESSGAAV